MTVLSTVRARARREIPFPKSSLTGAIARYGHIDANALWPQLSCGGCRQKPTNVSSSKTHKSQEPCLMAHQHRQKARGHLDGTSLVLCQLICLSLLRCKDPKSVVE